MGFDSEPEGDPHGECKLEIDSLNARIEEESQNYVDMMGLRDAKIREISAKDEEIRKLKMELKEAEKNRDWWRSCSVGSEGP